MIADNIYKLLIHRSLSSDIISIINSINCIPTIRPNSVPYVLMKSIAHLLVL